MTGLVYVILGIRSHAGKAGLVTNSLNRMDQGRLDARVGSRKRSCHGKSVNAYHEQNVGSMPCNVEDGHC